MRNCASGATDSGGTCTRCAANHYRAANNDKTTCTACSGTACSSGAENVGCSSTSDANQVNVCLANCVSGAGDSGGTCSFCATGRARAADGLSCPALTVSNCACGPCPADWTGPYHDGSTCACYRVYTDDMNWANSEAACVAQGGHLGSLASAGEQAWAETNIILISSTWIGLNDGAQEGTWVWTDGSTVSYTNWNTNEPNNSGDCAHVYNSADKFFKPVDR